MPKKSRSESDAHLELKRLAVAWAAEHRLNLAAPEVRLPRSHYRADVAATTTKVLAANALSAVFECKAFRADFLKDSVPEKGARQHIAKLSKRLVALRSLIGIHRPDLRRGEELFAEFDAYDLESVRHTTHDKLSADLRLAQRKLHQGTKFAKLGRWRAASLLYIVAEPEIIKPHELPDGWGLLIRRDTRLELVTKPCLNPTTVEERVGLLERITTAATKGKWQPPVLRTP